MRKRNIRIVIIIIVIAIFFPFIIKGLVFDSGICDRLLLDEKLHNVIEYTNEDKDGFVGVRYKELNYKIKESSLLVDMNFCSQICEDNFLISWNGPRWFYLDLFFANDSQNPVLIYESSNRQLFLREDYDYTNDIFVVSGTTIEMKFSDFIQSATPHYYSFDEHISIDIYSKDHPSIKASFMISSNKYGDIYVCPIDSPCGWKCSDTFVDSLIQNGIIPKA